MAVAGVGFLHRVTGKIRVYCNQPGTSSTFSDADLLDYVRRAWADVMSELNRVSAFKVRAQVDITVVADQREYALPPTIGQFLELKKLDSSGNLEWDTKPNHPLAPSGPGYYFHGPMLYFDPVWQTGYTMRIVYSPTAEAHSFEAIATSGSTTTAIEADSITAGTQDARAHAYVGYVMRKIDGSGDSTDDRLITAYDGTTFTVAPAFSASMASAAFEIVPNHAFRLEDIIALRVARFLSSITKDTERAQSLQSEYSDALRTLRLDHANAQARTGRHLQRSVRGLGRLGRTGR